MTQTCASIPQTSAWSRPARSKPSASGAEKQTFSIGVRPWGSSSATSGTVFPRPFGYCSVSTIGIPTAFAPLTSAAVAWATWSKLGTAFRNPSWTSMTTSAARAGSSFARAHATPIAKLRWR